MPEPWVERVVAPFVGAALVISQYVLLYWAMVTPHILMPQCGPKEYGAACGGRPGRRRRGTTARA